MTKTKNNDRGFSGAVVQYSKIAKTLADLTGNDDDMEENQEKRNGQIKPNFDTVYIQLSGSVVTPKAMGDNFKSCFDVRDAPPFKFILWDDRTEESTGDTMEDRTHLVTLDDNMTKCYVKYRSAGKNIADMVCKEPLVVNGEKVKEKPTLTEMINAGDKNTIACTENTDE